MGVSEVGVSEVAADIRTAQQRVLRASDVFVCTSSACLVCTPLSGGQFAAGAARLRHAKKQGKVGEAIQAAALFRLYELFPGAVFVLAAKSYSGAVLHVGSQARVRFAETTRGVGLVGVRAQWKVRASPFAQQGAKSKGGASKAKSKSKSKSKSQQAQSRWVVFESVKFPGHLLRVRSSSGRKSGSSAPPQVDLVTEAVAASGDGNEVQFQLWSSMETDHKSLSCVVQ